VNNAYHARSQRQPSPVYPHPSPTPAPTPTQAPRLDVNNRNRDTRVVGEALLAKNIQTQGTFASVILAMKEKGKPVPKNAAGQDHCLSWNLRGKFKADCVQKADHVPSSAALEPLFLWYEKVYE